MIPKQNQRNTCGLFYYFKKNIEVPRLKTNQNPYGLSCKISVFDNIYLYVIACFHYKINSKSEKGETCFYLSKKEDCYFPIGLRFQINKQEYTSINVLSNDLYQEMHINEIVKNKNFSKNEEDIQKYEIESKNFYKYDIYDVKNDEEIVIELSLCCFVLSDQLNILLKSYIGEYVRTEYHIFNSMKQFKFITDVVDWQTFENNFNPQYSNDSIMIFKSKKGSYVDNLLQNKQPKNYEYDNYLNYALRFHLQKFEINENLLQENYVPKINVVFIIATNIQEYKEKIVNVLMRIIQEFSRINSLFSLVMYNNVTINKQTIIKEDTLRTKIDENNNNQILQNFEITSSLQTLQTLIDSNELNMGIFITDKITIENNLNEISTLINEFKITFNVLTSFIYLGDINVNIQKTMSTIHSNYEIINRDSNIDHIKNSIINYLQPNQYITDVNISFLNEYFDKDTLKKSVVSNVFQYIFQYKTRNIKDSFTLFALIPEIDKKDLYISVSFKYKSKPIFLPYKYNLHSIYLDDINFLHHIIIRDFNCMTFDSWENSKKPIKKSIYQYLLYQVVGHELILPITSNIKNNTIIDYVERTSLYKSVFPVVVVVMKYSTKKKREIRLIPVCFMYVNFREFKQKYIQQEENENIIVQINNETLDDDKTLSNYDFKSGIKLKIKSQENK